MKRMCFVRLATFVACLACDSIFRTFWGLHGVRFSIRRSRDEVNAANNRGVQSPEKRMVNLDCRRHTTHLCHSQSHESTPDSRCC